MRRKSIETPSPDGTPNFPAPSRLLALVIIAAALLAYYNSFSGVFLFDGTTTIVRNQSIRQLGDVWNVLTSSRRPVVNLSLAVNYALHELDVWGYHAFNLTVHVLAGLTLYGIIRRTLLLPMLRQRYGESATWFALAASLIWVVHPLQTESVTYVIQRAESMMGLFYLLIV